MSGGWRGVGHGKKNHVDSVNEPLIDIWTKQESPCLLNIILTNNVEKTFEEVTVKLAKSD